MLKFTSIVGYTSCGPTYIESFLTIFGQCINLKQKRRKLNSRVAFNQRAQEMRSIRDSRLTLIVTLLNL